MPRRRLKSNLPLLLLHPQVFARFYRWPLLLLGAILDAVTTYVALRDYGAQAELHPVVRTLAYWLGVSPWSVACLKLMQSAFALFTASLWRPWCGILLAVSGVLYILAAVSNHFLLL